MKALKIVLLMLCSIGMTGCFLFREEQFAESAPKPVEQKPVLVTTEDLLGEAVIIEIDATNLLFNRMYAVRIASALTDKEGNRPEAGALIGSESQAKVGDRIITKEYSIFDKD